MKKETFVPIDQADTKYIKFDIPWHKWIPTENIGVNIERINQLRRFSGMRFLMIFGDPQGKTTEAKPTIAGIDTKGQAMAGQKVEIIPQKEFTTIGIAPQEYNYRKPPSRIYDGLTVLNLNEINQKILVQPNNKGVRDANEWSTQLDLALKSAINKLGTESLINNLTPIQKMEEKILIASPFVASFASMGMGQILGGGSLGMDYILATLPAYYFLGNLMVNVLDYNNYKQVINDLKRDFPQYSQAEWDDFRSFRWSLFHYRQYDRALMLNLMTKNSTLVKKIN